MISRRSLLRSTLANLALGFQLPRIGPAPLCAAAPGVAGTPAAPDEGAWPDQELAIARGLAYLARQQQPDGAILSRERNSPENAPRFSGPRIALTGLSAMAFIAAGRLPDVGRHGAAVRNAVDFLVKNAPGDGYFGKVDGSRMYGHAIATMALAEVCGMEAADAGQRKKLRSSLEKAVKVLLSAQNTKKEPNFAGGWRYDVSGNDSDLSVTGWCLLALRAANNAGVEVPRDSATRAAAFVLKCFRPEKGGFAYQPGADPSIAMTGVGTLALVLLDQAQRPEVARAAAWLVDHPVQDDTDYPYYARYYATQAAYQLGGDAWPKIWNRNQESILRLQQKEKDGSWPVSRTANEPGPTYSTAMSIMTLAIALRLLPGYQK